TAAVRPPQDEDLSLMTSKTCLILRSALRAGSRKGHTNQFAMEPKRSSMRVLVTDRPHIICHGGEISLGELRATHGRHHPLMLLRLWYSWGDGPGNRPDAAVAPQPLAARQIGAHCRAFAVGAVTPSARSASGLSVENAFAQRDLVGRSPRWCREWCRAGVRMG